MPDDGLTMVGPGVDHRFLALEDQTQLYELYTAVGGRAIDAGDIVRSDLGGRLSARDFPEQGFGFTAEAAALRLEADQHRPTPARPR